MISKYTSLVLLLTTVGAFPQLNEERAPFPEAAKRSLLDFGLMILCGTKRNPLDYNTYGCYCGFNGHGTPVDDVDRCCQEHDECYNDIIKRRVCPFEAATYVIPYSSHSCTECKPPSYYWFYGKCRHALCQCDAIAVKCFKRSKYNPKYAGYPNSRC
ncbi:phospholipase A2 A2-actitoxin-Cgg2a [Nematostella vectensis]|uniref:phospholipase A2 A2-actitoxin-Cgg2a n=1 Tax=Nematostella vectensis TaxID=45351 RepID=UPI0013901DAC|nr:phospholipase A2 A2-actitoxin-Cgg2a [Nematostella vectensis]